tara:strand:+ start:3154 stop:4041 length:888 start_codon:yes stop_codon:yes gene_type:complete
MKEFKINIDNNLKKSSKIISKKDYMNIVNNFKKYGAITFSNISSNINNVGDFIDLFSNSYSNDAKRRKVRFNNKKFRDVDVGFDEVILHSETSFSPTRPEIVWFYCNKPPKTNSGKTLICDGIDLWNNLSAETKIFFIGEPVCYSVKVPFEKKIQGIGKKKWYLDKPGVRKCYLNYKSQSIEFDYLKFAVQKSLYDDKLCFSNHLLVPVTGKQSEEQMMKKETVGKKKIPEKIMQEIKNKANLLKKAKIWKKYDLVMLDNIRFMHGREKINKKEKDRDIVTIQTSKTKFKNYFYN